MYSTKQSEELLKCKKINAKNISDGKSQKIKDEDLINDVFEQINKSLSPTISSPKINLVPPNTFRSEIDEINNKFGNEEIKLIRRTPSLESPLSQCKEEEEEDYEENIKKKQKKLKDEMKINLTNIMLATEEKINNKKNEEIEIQQIEITLTESNEIINNNNNINEEEKFSLNLLKHKNSLENENKFKKEKEEEEDEESEEILLTPSTGEGCLDSINEETQINNNNILINYNNNNDDYNEQQQRRISSELSRKLINSVIEMALENNEELNNNNKIKKQKNSFQLELDKKIKQYGSDENNEIILNNNNNSISSQSSPNSSSSSSNNNNNFRDIHVRTSLNDPSLPFKQLAYTAFEPEKQEIIRKEIGSFGPENIKKIVDKFQNKFNNKKEEINNINKPKVFPRQKSAHFYIEKEQVPKQQEDQPKRKNTPHPIHRQSSLNQPENEEKINNKLFRSEIIIESQRPVADILNQFQSCHYSHANTKALKEIKDEENYLRKVRPKSFGSSDMQRNFSKNTSIWANNNTTNKIINEKEPTPGSLAAIRLSLNSSIPSTPSVSPINYSPPNGTEKLIGEYNNNKQKEINNNNNLLHGKDGILPKNVGHFYRIWGSAQAQNATKITEKQSKIMEKNIINNLTSNEQN